MFFVGINGVRFDVDNIEIDSSVEDYVNEITKDYRYICYSTASSKIDAPKFRIIFSLDRNVEKDEIKHFWFALNKELGSIGDEQTKDLSRMYYIPAKYENANNFMFNRDGKNISVKSLLEKHPYSERSNNFIDNLPEAVQKQIIEHRKNQSNNKNFRGQIIAIARSLIKN